MESAVGRMFSGDGVLEDFRANARQSRCQHPDQWLGLLGDKARWAAHSTEATRAHAGPRLSNGFLPGCRWGGLGELVGDQTEKKKRARCVVWVRLANAPRLGRLPKRKKESR